MHAKKIQKLPFLVGRYALEKACGSVTEKKRNRGQMSLTSIRSERLVKSQNTKYTLLKNVQIDTTFFCYPKYELYD